MRAIWPSEDGEAVLVIDQRHLPHRLEIARLGSAEDVARAIREMWVRGAPLIGAAAAYGVALAARRDPSDVSLSAAIDLLGATRPTAINLRWALERVRAALLAAPAGERAALAARIAAAICDEEVARASAIGDHGLAVLRTICPRRPDGVLRVLTHCNAGWLAAVDWGTALAPIYKAHRAGIPLHVWVDETRPRGQGARLTAWELGEEGVPHTVIADGASGHLVQRGLVDVCIVGSDRVTAGGDVCNKIGTYLVALAARDGGVPLYAALPGSTIDWSLRAGADIPIEERDADEVRRVRGLGPGGEVVEVLVTPPQSPAANPAFDVTPARLVSGLITERGVCAASAEGLLSLYPDRAAA